MNEFRYPQASRLDLTEDILGHQVSDPYRWLEDDTNAERAGWLAAQADMFGSDREELPGRDRLAARGRELLSTTSSEAPEGVLVDPMAIDPAGRTTLDAWQPDKGGRLLDYQLSEGGDEE